VEISYGGNIMYVHGEMRPTETIPGIRKGDKGE
jgi:hypothetical protein